MASPVDSVGPDDEILTAYLDGEIGADERATLGKRLAAEPELAARLAMLRRGDRAFAPAFEALLDAAPAAGLSAMLDQAIARDAAASRGRSRSPLRVLAAIAAALVLFVAGAAGGILWLSLQPKESPGWRQVVAEYQSLTTAETLAAISDDPAAVAHDLAAAGGKLDLSLTPTLVALPNLALKRVQLYSFRDRPLAQVAYLSPDSGPVALCIIANGRPDAPPAFEQREGYNIVFWQKDGRGYMLIGKTPQAELEAFASDLVGRFS